MLWRFCRRFFQPFLKRNMREARPFCVPERIRSTFRDADMHMYKGRNSCCHMPCSSSPFKLSIISSVFILSKPAFFLKCRILESGCCELNRLPALFLSGEPGLIFMFNLKQVKRSVCFRQSNLKQVRS